jgi:hypothetical protein
LKKVPDPFVSVIEEFCVLLVEPLHAAGETDFRRLDQEVVVIGHENPGMKNPAPLGDDSREKIDEAEPIGVIAVDVALLVAAAGDVPDGSREFESKLARHGRGGERRKGRRRSVWFAQINTRTDAHEQLSWGF